MSSIKDGGRESNHAYDKGDLGQYSLDGKPVLCPHCHGTQFKADMAQLNTALATLLNLDWTNHSAVILICASCSRIQWFARQPLRIS